MSRVNRMTFTLSVLVALLFVGSIATRAATLQPLTVTEDPNIWGAQGNRLSATCAISGNGAVLAFISEATQLVPNDRNGIADVFVHAGGTLTRVSRRISGAEARRGSTSTSLSDSGRYLVFLNSDDLLETMGGVPGTTSAYHLDLQTGVLQRASNRMNGSAATAGEARVSGDGRYVVFTSSNADVVTGDTNNVTDVFRYDTQAGITIRVSVSASGAQTSATSGSVAIDDSGDVIAFTSGDGSLIPGDTNGRTDVFVKRISTGAIVRASQSSAGVASNATSFTPALSGNGAFVVFNTSADTLVAGDTNGHNDVFRHEVATGATVRVSEGALGEIGNASSSEPTVSQAGRYIWFRSFATNFAVPAPTTAQIYRKDMQTAELLHAYSDPIGARAVSASDSGAVACVETASALLASDNNGLVDVYRLDAPGGALSLVSVANTPIPTLFGNEFSGLCDVSRDASRVIACSRAADLDAESFAEFSALIGQFFTTEQVVEITAAQAPSARVVGRPNGTGALVHGSPSASSVSADGNWLSFVTDASLTLPAPFGSRNVYRQQLPSGAPQAISIGLDSLLAGGVADTAINATGSRIAFTSTATNLVVGDSNGQSDVFLWDVATGLRRISVSSAGAEANFESSKVGMDDAGAWAVFRSSATNLVTGDTNNATDIFLHELATGVTQRMSADTSGAQLSVSCDTPAISPDGRYVAYYVGGATPAHHVFDRVSGTTRVLPAPAGHGLRSTSLRFGRDPRYLSFVSIDAANSDYVAYRYDILDNSLRELYRATYDAIDSPRRSIESARVASATKVVIATNNILSDFDRNNDDDLLLITLQPGALSFTSATLSVSEGAGTVLIPVQRTGGAEGAVSAATSIIPISATAADFTTPVTVAGFSDNQTTPANLQIVITEDALVEGNETFTVELVSPAGGATVGAPATLLVTIVDNELADPIFANGFE